MTAAVPDSATVQERPSTPVSAAVASPGTLADCVRRAAALRGRSPALIWFDRTITWAELDSAVDETARALRALVPSTSEAHPGRVALALGNSPDFAIAFFATLRAGLVAVPVNPASTAPELRHVLADSAAALLICTDRVRERVAEVAGKLPALASVRTTLPTPADAGGPVAADWPDSPAGGDQLAVLLYTSGTEGRPKGAMLSHRALLANHEQAGRIEPPVVGAEDVLLLALPLFHAYGLNSGLGAVAYHGACGVLVERFEPRAALEIVARYRVSVVMGVPSMFLAWSPPGRRDAGAAAPAEPDLVASLASVRLVICGAAPLEAGAARRFTETTGHQIFVGYGLTETAPVLTLTLASARPKAGSIGVPIPGVELRLVSARGDELWRDGSAELADEDELELDLLAPGTDPGEIVVRGANLFSGYWPDGRGGPDAEGWWATGDIAYADEEGDLFLVDRLGELILVNGFNVYPREVELVLEAHPGVAESAVLGVPHPVAGQAVEAYVVRASGGTTPTAADLSAHCARHLARFKCPTEIRFVDTLPHSAIGKVRKTMLGPVPRTPDAPPRARRPDEQQ